PGWFRASSSVQRAESAYAKHPKRRNSKGAPELSGTKNFPKEERSVNKTELIARVAEKTDLTKKAAGDAVEAVLETITEALSAGDKGRIVGFGTFELRDPAARRRVNPATGEAIGFRASRVPAFKAGKSLKEKVGGK